jgi:hypothetical protein
MTNKEKKFIEDMKRCRGIDWIRIGMKVEVAGRSGIIIGMNSSANLDVVFWDGTDHPKITSNCHPTWKIKYFDAKGNIIKEF